MLFNPTSVFPSVISPHPTFSYLTCGDAAVSCWFMGCEDINQRASPDVLVLSLAVWTPSPLCMVKLLLTTLIKAGTLAGDHLSSMSALPSLAEHYLSQTYCTYCEHGGCWWIIYFQPAAFCPFVLWHMWELMCANFSLFVISHQLLKYHQGHQGHQGHRGHQWHRGHRGPTGISTHFAIFCTVCWSNYRYFVVFKNTINVILNNIEY